MGFNFFKKKKEKEKQEKEAEKIQKAESSVDVVKKLPAGDSIGYYKIKSPHVSEKASNISAQGQYIFRVSGDSNKTEIKKAIGRLYGVNVRKVNVIYVPSKKRQVGKYKGKKKGYKKAIVVLEKGQTIEVAPK